MKPWIVKISWFKKSGKWAYEDEITLNVDPWDTLREICQEIVDTQDRLTNGWQGNYYVMLDDLEESRKDRNYKFSWTKLIEPEAFIGVLKNKEDKK